MKDYGSLRGAAEQVRENSLQERARPRTSGNDQLRLHRGLRLASEGALRPRGVREAALDRSDPYITPAMVYAYAALQEDVPYANDAPSLAADIPALVDLADERGVLVAGKDFKARQTLMKTVFAPGLKASGVSQFWLTG